MVYLTCYTHISTNPSKIPSYPMSHLTTIHLVNEVTDADLAVLRRYLGDAIHLSEAEWRRLRVIINRLAESEINFAGLSSTSFVENQRQGLGYGTIRSMEDSFAPLAETRR